jgi:hypothetical protein
LEDVAVRSIILVAILALLAPLLLAASQQADGTPGWTKSGRTYHTTQVLPAGTRVRVRVDTHGKKFELMLVEWHGGKKKDGRYSDLEAWPANSLRRGQVLRFKLPRAMKIGLRVGRKNARELGGATAMYGYHQLRFGERWRVDVRAIDPTF